MGSNASKFITESEMSDSDTEPEESQLSQTMPISDVQIDAALRIRSNESNSNLTIEKLQKFETQLDKYEIISLVFLLYEEAELALQTLIVFLASNNKDILSRWAMSQKNNKQWQEKLVEALSIIQNYEILKILGFDKEYLMATYLPRRPQISNSIKKRKVLYLLAENMDDATTCRFLSKMEHKLKEFNIPFQNFNDNYLELYFLDWERNRFNFVHMKTVFKSMDLDAEFAIIEETFSTDEAINPVLPTSVTIKYNTKQKSTTKDTTYKYPSSSPSSCYSGTSSSSFTEQSQDNSIVMPIDQKCLDSDRYFISRDKPGVVLIINQEDFYTEINPKYKNLLHDQSKFLKLDTRDGTKQDKNRLIVTFKKFGFNIIIKENLAHYDLLKAIEQTTLDITDESSLFVCILSHGDNGVIFGANSCRVDVSRIQKIMCRINKNILRKPKVLILQSCQGKQCQKVDSEDDLDDDYCTRDGPLNNVPTMTDLLTFWATIPGYAAIRNVKNGSWLIQALCDEIDQNAAQYHLMDICTKVVNKVSDKSWREKKGINVMTPMLVSTFRKNFYLPNVKSV